MPASSKTASSKKTRKPAADRAVKTHAEPAVVPVDYERLKGVSGNVRLHNVLLRDVSLLCVGHPRRESPEFEKQFSYGLSDATWSRDENQLHVQLRYRVQGDARSSRSDAGTALEQLFSLECQWEASFLVLPEFGHATSEAMADFAFVNGQVNVFPYLRQLVQDLTGRAGWVPLVLPTFKIPVQRPTQLGLQR